MSSIIELKGVGEKKARLWGKLGIYTITDLIEYYPHEYKDRSQITKIADLRPGEPATLLCRVIQKPENIRFKGIVMTKTKVRDETGALDVVWFNMPYMRTVLKEGGVYYMTGAPGNRYGKMTLANPEFEAYGDVESLSHSRIVPVYRATRGLTQKAIRQTLQTALLEAASKIIEHLPQSILHKTRLCDKKHAVLNIHFPETNEAFLEARNRLCFDELFVLQAALFRFKNKRLNNTKGFSLNDAFDYNEIIRGLLFELTNAQKTVLSEIKRDMSCGLAMNRLIQGDVGSGKTAVALIASYWAIQNGFQAALMAPTEVLATQHYESISYVLARYGVETALLKGAMTKSQKDAALSAIASGRAKMVIGTHAVIQKTVIFNKLGLVITDEQHRFGVRQRGALREKGESPHVLVMTATPIPRTLALILYGDLDISIIDELPPGRREIETYAVGSAARERVYGFIRKQLDEGRQAYIICPAIEEKDDENENINKLELSFVNEQIKRLKTEVFAGYSIASLHGKMKPAEKDEIMGGFAAGEIALLVSTTVIEVGINVPNATVMLIENAERFGLSQLHQLRGRVGRGEHKSYCILMSDSAGEIAKERMETLKSTTDGFKISEMDLKLRGSGDFFGTRQHGLPELKIANLFTDIKLLKLAQTCAEELIAEDPLLERPENAGLAAEIDKMFGDVKFGVHL